MNTRNKLGRSFDFLNATQFAGALNDNLFKFLVMIYLTSKIAAEETNLVTAKIGAVFVIPFLLFLPLAGKVADRFSKRDIVVAAKIAEAGFMVFGAVGFWLQSPVLLYTSLFLMAGQSAFFSPAKYGIIPELVKTEQLSRANSFVEAMTYLAIIFGTAGAPFILEHVTGGGYAKAGLICILFSVIGITIALPIRKTMPAGGDGEKSSAMMISSIWQTLKEIRENRHLLLAVLASAYFLMVGGFIQMNLMAYGRETLGLNATNSAYLFFFCAVGIGLGSFWAGKISGRHIELGIVPLGALGLSAAMLVLAGIGTQGPAFVTLVVLGFSGGMFIVPIHAYIQYASPDDKRGRVLAASSFLGWVGVLLSAGLLYLFQMMGLSSNQIFVVISFLTLGLTGISVSVLPDFLVRFLTLFIARICYRIKAVDPEKVPAQGGVLIVSNHVSWVDAVLLSATQTRRIRFIMDKDVYQIWYLRPIFRLMRCILISSGDPPKQIVKSLKEAREAMESGDIVCIFAEGTITRTGMLREFKEGFRKIMKNSGCKIVPAYIGGAWGSIFSYYRGKLLGSMPRKFPYPVSVHFGDPLDSDASTTFIRQKVMELSCDYFNDKKATRKTLAETFVRTARRKPGRKCVSDTTGKRLNYFQTLTAAVVLRGKIKQMTAGQDKVGILLPPSVGGTVSNIAVSMLGKTSVNLNYVTSADLRKSAIEQCKVKTVITSKSFVEKAGVEENIAGAVYIEDLVKAVTGKEKFFAFLKSVFVPAKILTHSRGKKGDDIATVIFSSGTTGDPKGVMLSHHNILSNIETLKLVFKINKNDDLCAVLPFFHSFGFTCSLWLPITTGVSCSFVPNPLDGKLVGKSVRENGSTILFAPPTFLLNYLRRCEKKDFASIREVVVGAEKLKEKLADAFEKKFGIRLLEGYGMTELSPVVSLNLPDADIGGVYQPGRKPGTVGHPLPGVAAKIIDAETGEDLGTGTPGMLMVKGPNVMVGYLDRPEETAEKFIDGWYKTGDIASIDTDGFIRITDRLSRFSKIGGEMVPHIAIEEVLLRGLSSHENVVAVTSVPDARKGEELVVLYLKKADNADKLYTIAAESELPKLWLPKKNNFFMIDEMPTLGSGKLDIMGIKELAAERKFSEG